MASSSLLAFYVQDRQCHPWRGEASRDQKRPLRRHGLIRALRDSLGKAPTIMDYFDRWGGSGRFFGDSDGISLPPCPDWLQDVPSYQESCPEADLLVFDLSWTDAEFRLRELLARAPHRRPFQHVALAGWAGAVCP